MYSICVNQHHQHNHRYTGYAILISIKQDGIDESSRGHKLYKTKQEAREGFEKRIVAMLQVTHGKKENEI